MSSGWLVYDRSVSVLCYSDYSDVINSAITQMMIIVPIGIESNVNRALSFYLKCVWVEYGLSELTIQLDRYTIFIIFFLLQRYIAKEL